VAAAVVLEPVAGPAARLLADGAGLCLDLLAGVAGLAARVPGGHFAVPRPSVPLWLAGGAAAAIVLHLGRGLRPAVRGLVAAGSVAALLLMVPRGAAAGEGGLEIAFLDVGQGDAVAIRTPAGRWLLVDAGPIEERYDAGERRVLPYLRARGATRVEAMVLTHPHADHIGGAPAVMRGMPVGRLVEPGLPFASPLYREVLRTARTRGVAWAAARQDRVIRIDGVEIVILWPTPPSLDSPEDANDISAVLQIRYGAFRALLEGDAPAWVEERLVARYGEALRSPVLKAGHHGSRTATSAAYLRAVSPQLVVLSCGRRNRYGHPHAETLARLRAAGAGVARTDRDGTVVVRVDPGGGAWRWDSP
jgi:competence protein ComEC